MKNISILILIALFLSCKKDDEFIIVNEPCIIEKPIQKRQNITFILGEDKGETNKYYQLAEAYYRSNPKTNDDVLVTTCRSLAEVRNYLDSLSIHRNLPWGKLNLVVHSNEWTGLGVPIFENGQRTTASNLSFVIETNRFPSLEDNILDENSEIIIYACGLGKNKKLVDLIGRVFCGDEKVNISASNYFIMYEQTAGVSKRYEANAYYTYFKTGYRPANYKLIKQFEKQYPDVNVDWSNALSKKQPNFKGDGYNYYFNIPVKWVVTFESKSDRPSLNTDEQKNTWLLEQFDLMEIINKSNIPMDKFRWQFKYEDYTFEDGVTEPAIVVNGKSSVMCVLKARN